MKILVIEDEKSTRTLIIELLKEENYSIFEAENGEKGMRIAAIENPELIILDINLPDLTGFEICDKIRQNPGTYGDPIILILTVEQEQQKVCLGLIKGADDYLKKPFDFNEFVLRIKAFQRRIEKTSSKAIQYGKLSIDIENMAVRAENIQIDLKRKEVELLILLIINKGLLLSRNKIMKEIWARDYIEGDRIVDVTVRRIKEKISYLENKIISVRGIGYRLLVL